MTLRERRQSLFPTQGSKTVNKHEVIIKTHTVKIDRIFFNAVLSYFPNSCYVKCFGIFHEKMHNVLHLKLQTSSSQAARGHPSWSERPLVLFKMGKCTKKTSFFIIVEHICGPRNFLCGLCGPRGP